MGNKKTPEVNSGSMADISFLLLTFFLLTSSINTDQGISRKLPPPIVDEKKDVDVKKRNVLQVLVNMNDQLLVNGEPGDILTLKDEAVKFLTNPTDDLNKSEQKTEEIGSLGTVRKSKGVISLQNDRGTSYGMYIKVQNELTRAVNEIRDNLSLNKFGKKYEDLNEELKKDIQSAVPIAISEAEPKNIGGKK
jgi:biopolymer transport protein ExbD